MSAREKLEAVSNAREILANAPTFSKQSSLKELARKHENLAVPVGSGKRAAAAVEGVEKDLSTLIEGIHRLGSPGVFEGSLVVKFGTIFKDDKLANQLESLVGTLKAGRKRGLLAWEGQLLLQGKDDDAPITLLAGGHGTPLPAVVHPEPVVHHNRDCDAETIETEKLERAKSVALVVEAQEQERARQLAAMYDAEQHTLLARQATIEEAKEALEAEQQRRVSLSHPELKQVHALVRKHSQNSAINMMEAERQRRIDEAAKVDAPTPPKIDLTAVPVIN